jgi:hypothetical protein
MRVYRQLVALAAAVFLSSQVLAQSGQTTTPSVSAGSPSSSWSFSLTVDGYVVRHAVFFVSPTLAADRGWLHLEARYNDENLNTGSVWVGRHFSLGDKLTIEVTPMIGGVFGDTTGIAPGFQASLSYRKVTLSTSGEFVFDTKDRNGSFFYSWPQLTYSPLDWFRVGLTGQRTKAYHTSLSTQRGLLIGFNHKRFQFTTYIFNAGWTAPTLILEGGVTF